MSNNSKDINIINVDKLFNNDKYIFSIPIYQRNYAWEETEINALLDDIIKFDTNYNYNDTEIGYENNNNKYYLGTLVVCNKKDGSGQVYEVIDGQQRLTTLFLIYLYIENNHKNNLGGIKLVENDLKFEIREKYSNTLNALKKEDRNDDPAEEIILGYNLIKDYFGNNKEKIKHFIENLNNIEIAIINVPKDTDTITYFTIMNTRGEQLELHQIAKASFINKVGDKDIDRKIVAEIWDACSNMDYHVQRNFSNDIRKNLFKENLMEFADGIETFPKDITKAWENLRNIFKDDNNNSGNSNTIINIINNKCTVEKNNDNKKNDDNSYNSIISFPYFLLHVNASMIEGDDDIDKLYDDKNLLNNLNRHLEDSEAVKKYIYYMLQCRFLFDKYIVKRKSDDYNDSKGLVLVQYTRESNNYKYRNTIFNYKKENQVNKWEENNSFHNLIRIQSTLRYTYISPRNMRWITELLKYTMRYNKFYIDDLIELLEKYCIDKIKDINLNNLSYGNITRIVFTYLDYVLYKDNYKNIKKMLEEWVVRSRNSIEHFQPQNPKYSNKWKESNLHSFGNLALITVSENSEFSNSDPKDKAKNEKYSHIINNNPKLKLMASYDEWNEENMKEHEKEMINILQNEINRFYSKTQI